MVCCFRHRNEEETELTVMMSMISDSDACFLRAVRDGNLEEVVSLLDKDQNVDAVNYVSADLCTVTVFFV